MSIKRFLELNKSSGSGCKSCNCCCPPLTVFKISSRKALRIRMIEPPIFSFLSF
jgi:hypothetical protein